MTHTNPLKDNRIKKHFLDPWKEVEYSKLLNVAYADSDTHELLSDSKDGVHIISHELILTFSNNKSLFISWNWDENWEQYVLSFSTHTFFKDTPNKYSMTQNDWWAQIINRKCQDITIWGYRKYDEVIENPTNDASNEKVQTYFNQPHLAMINFGADKHVYFANFYFEDDFNPKIPVGDDLWIVFENKKAATFIDRFKFDLFK